MTFLLIGIAVYALGSYWDIDYSELVRKAGGDEWNFLERDHNKKFLATRALMLHAGFAAFVLISHFTWLPDDQKPYTGVIFLLIGAVSFAVAFAVNRPLYKKLLRTTPTA